MSKEIDVVLKDIYSKESTDIEGMKVSDKLILFHRLIFNPPEESEGFSLPPEFWYPLVPNYQEYLTSMDDEDFLWDIVSEKFYSLAEIIISFDYPYGMTSGSSHGAVWDFGGENLYFGDIPDQLEPRIYCAIEKKKKKKVLFNLMKKLFETEGNYFVSDRFIGTTLAPFITTHTFSKDEMRSIIEANLRTGNTWEANLIETIENEEGGFSTVIFEDWMELKDSEAKELSNPYHKIFKDYSCKELTELLRTGDIFLSPELKNLVLDFIVDAKVNQGPWVND